MWQITLVGHASCTPSFIRHAIKSSKDRISHSCALFTVYIGFFIARRAWRKKREREKKPPILNRFDRKNIFPNRETGSMIIRGCIELLPRSSILCARILSEGLILSPVRKSRIETRKEKKKKILINHVILKHWIEDSMSRRLRACGSRYVIVYVRWRWVEGKAMKNNKREVGMIRILFNLVS